MITGKLNRLYLQAKCTIGILTLSDGEKTLFQCYTLEDEVRGNGDPATVAKWKVKGESAIPYGTYKVLRTFSQRFSKYTWELQNVPGFAGIRIHAGNTAKDTEGCILLGRHIGTDYNAVADSRAAVAELDALLASMKVAEWELTITREGV